MYIVVDPPENLTVSWDRINVNEGEKPHKVYCKARAYPAATYIWMYENQTVSIGDALQIDKPMKRSSAGRYMCVAHNKHGNATVHTYVNVLCKYIHTLRG